MAFIILTTELLKFWKTPSVFCGAVYNSLPLNCMNIYAIILASQPRGRVMVQAMNKRAKKIEKKCRGGDNPDTGWGGG